MVSRVLAHKQVPLHDLTCIGWYLGLVVLISSIVGLLILVCS